MDEWDGVGFEVDGGVFLIRCPACKQENYALAVASGVCVWCGYDANKKKSEEQSVGNSK